MKTLLTTSLSLAALSTIALTSATYADSYKKHDSHKHVCVKDGKADGTLKSEKDCSTAGGTWEKAKK